jgi:AraC-like DNA-binding protein
MRFAHGDEFAPFRFSTEEFPAGDRVGMLRNVLRQRFSGIEIEPLPDRPFQIEASFRGLPGLGMLSVYSLAAHARRSREHVADGHDSFWLAIVSSGACIIRQGGAKIVLEHGDATLLSAAEPASVICPAMSHSVIVSIPTSSLVPLVADIDKAVMRLIPRSTEALKLLTVYLGFFKREVASGTPDLRSHATNHIHDLVALALGATSEAGDMAQDRSVPAARMRALKADVIDNLGRPDLSIDVAAARHGITPRHVRRLFEAEGTTFSAFVLAQRLTRTHQMLSDPRLSERTISAIAFENGFGDLSYFNRTFRRAYGTAPTDVRASMKCGLD